MLGYRSLRGLAAPLLIGTVVTASVPGVISIRVHRGDTLSAIADHYYGRPASWRAIADQNNVEDPRRMRAGTPLTVPSLR